LAEALDLLIAPPKPLVDPLYQSRDSITASSLPSTSGYAPATRL
jgi:hypothetical protein